ncbi:hypothetical protein BDZ89DRAFT_1124604 [Hymenopellis radicata]|nr:hypothetical protein BDZ89DRAFT_1124604 [Hymenopellis radicata]
MTTTFDPDDLRVSHVLFALAVAYCCWKIVTLYIFFRPRNEHSLRSVAILVLGDIGRSPRMMYHAESFAENGFQTDIIGYGGSKPIPALERLPLVQLRYLPQLPSVVGRLPFVLLAPIKIIHQVLTIILVLLVQIPQPPEFILVQNPPSIPTLAIVALVGRIRGCKVIIDWHNLGYSILALKLGSNHLFVRIAKWIEATFGRCAYAHLFVTQAMHDFLVKEWDLQGRKVVLHDRPPRHFHHSSPQEVHDLLIKLKHLWTQPKVFDEWLPECSIPYSTPFTDTTGPSKTIESRIASPSPTSGISSKASNPFQTTIMTPTRSMSPISGSYTHIHSPRLRHDRPALVVSSTSWTPDEDFGVLKDALVLYEKRARNAPGTLPKLLMVVTGKGPMREAYMKEVNQLQKEWIWVRCVTVWLEPEDYPLLLGSCDLGVSLHSSSSALDLPMKVVDMFGCGLPVCALRFACLGELVKEGVNGLIFDNAAQLAKQLEVRSPSFLVSFV